MLKAGDVSKKRLEDCEKQAAHGLAHMLKAQEGR
jgi:hypothetical protein